MIDLFAQPPPDSGQVLREWLRPAAAWVEAECPKPREGNWFDWPGTDTTSTGFVSVTHSGDVPVVWVGAASQEIIDTLKLVALQPTWPNRRSVSS